MGVELLAVVLMIAVGSAVAMLVVIARVGKGEKPHAHGRPAAPDRDGIAASLLIGFMGNRWRHGTPRQPDSSRSRAPTKR
jgi:hypothetical protein